jgi:hypothetical protein
LQNGFLRQVEKSDVPERWSQDANDGFALEVPKLWVRKDNGVRSRFIVRCAISGQPNRDAPFSFSSFREAEAAFEKAKKSYLLLLRLVNRHAGGNRVVLPEFDCSPRRDWFARELVSDDDDDGD